MTSVASQSDRLRTAPESGGFTLLEMVVTVAIMSVIMLGLSSAMIIAGHAVPDAGNPASARITAAQAAERIAAELQYAVSINSQSAHMVEFTVADRDGNDVPEIIRYEWSGTAGDPLTRQYNGGTLAEVLPGVQELDLAYDITAVTTETPQENESAETLLASYDSTVNLKDYSIKESQWYGQVFNPSLPTDAVRWSVTRVEFFAKANGASDGECCVQLRLLTIAGYPSECICGRARLVESTLLSTYLKQEFVFSDVVGLSPDRGLSLVFEWIADTEACVIRGRSPITADPDNHLVSSTTQGASWTPSVNQSLLLWVYGTVTTTGTPLVETIDHLESVQIQIRTSEGDQGVVQTGVRTLNEPEVIS